jgi:hypothetical protein
MYSVSVGENEKGFGNTKKHDTTTKEKHLICSRNILEIRCELPYTEV